MANVNEVKLCPNCDKALPLPHMQKCPYCKALLRSPENSFFDTPIYLTMQLSDHLDEIKSRYGKDPKKLSKASEEVFVHYYAILKVLPREDILGSLRDTRAIMQNLLVSDADLSTIKIAASLGESIGKLSKLLNEYVSEGGQAINIDHLASVFDTTPDQQNLKTDDAPDAHDLN